MRILAVIPARGGSKRLPGKNIRPLAGRPLIVWSIDAARGIPEICDCLVSTDDPAIADVARGSGAFVPWLRPGPLATDVAGSVDVALHALDWYEESAGPVDGLLLLQPTSPFRTRQTIRAGIDQFGANGRPPVVSVSTARVHPMWTVTIEGGRLVPFMKDHGLSTRSQDLPPCYVVNGILYLIAPADLRRERSFVAGAVALVVDSPREIVDIDTEEDWILAEYFAHDGAFPGS